MEVATNRDVETTLRKELKQRHYHAVIHAMAVLDFELTVIRKTKIASRKGGWTLRLKPAAKIITQIKKWSPRVLLVGFKLEVGLKPKSLLQRARRLQKEAQADFVLANQLTEGPDHRHAGWLLDKKGRVIATAKGKKALAKLIFSALDR